MAAYAVRLNFLNVYSWLLFSVYTCPMRSGGLTALVMPAGFTFYFGQYLPCEQALGWIYFLRNMMLEVVSAKLLGLPIKSISYKHVLMSKILSILWILMVLFGVGVVRSDRDFLQSSASLIYGWCVCFFMLWSALWKPFPRRHCWSFGLIRVLVLLPNVYGFNFIVSDSNSMLCLWPHDAKSLN